MRRFVLLIALSVAACDVSIDSGPAPAVAAAPGQGFSPTEASAAFRAVTSTVEPWQNANAGHAPKV